jgi:hypothetical protein
LPDINRIEHHEKRQQAHTNKVGELVFSRYTIDETEPFFMGANQCTDGEKCRNRQICQVSHGTDFIEVFGLNGIVAGSG